MLGIDRYTPPHSLGSSHGQTRIIREAYFEDPQNVPIVQQAYENWEKLEKAHGHQLYLQTGGLMMGRPHCEIVKGAILSAELHHLQYEILNAKEIKKRLSTMNSSDVTTTLWEPRAGILFPEESIKPHIEIAVRNRRVNGRRHHEPQSFPDIFSSASSTNAGSQHLFRAWIQVLQRHRRNTFRYRVIKKIIF